MKLIWKDENKAFFHSLDIFIYNFLAKVKLTISPKGQIISEWIYEVIISPKIRRINCQDFCPLYTGQKSWQFFVRILVEMMTAPKKIFQKNPLKKILQKNISRKIPPKKFPKKILLKKSPKISPKISKKYLKKFKSKHIAAHSYTQTLFKRQLKANREDSLTMKVYNT